MGARQSSAEKIAIKAAVRLRDGYRCTECGLTEAEHRATTGKALDVHRLNPGSLYTVDGCVTLCRRCHGPKRKLASRWGDGQRLPDGCRGVRLDPAVYEQLAQLAEHNDRPLNWELRRIVVDYLRSAGLWPPPNPPAGD